MVKLRMCSQCKDSKAEILEFFRNRNEKSRRDKFRSICRLCEVKNRKQWGLRMVEHIRNYRNKEVYLAKARVYTKLYRATHKTERSFLQRRRAIRRKASVQHFTLAEWSKIKQANCYMCLSCLRREPEIILTVDHIVPLSKGGMDSALNIQPLCQSCNSKKRTKTIDYIAYYAPHPV